MHGELNMTPLEYLLPETMEEALQYLERGVPLAGGTGLTPRRNELKVVVDLRNLGLDGIGIDGEVIKIGATTTLQSMVETELDLPEKLRESCRLEFGWNLRNRATIGGVIMDSDGRSPLLTTLLGLNAQITQQPGPVIVPLDELLDDRAEIKLITQIRFDRPHMLLYEQISRTPADFPLVSAALAHWDLGDREKFNIAIGGHGDRPRRLLESETISDENLDIPSIVAMAETAYAGAGDEWAGADYRSEVAGILVQRLLREVIH
jgi:putative selenate reductase FAD-binding subunit